MVVALKPLHDAGIIKRVVVSTYQSVSGAGKDAMNELYSQTKSIFEANKLAPKLFTRSIAFNVIPHIDSFLDNGMTKEEAKMINETKKILDPAISVSATCVRVPVFTGHAESVNITLERNLSVDEVRNILRSAPGITVVDDPSSLQYTTPLECVKEDNVFVSRIRQDESIENGFNLWVVADNLRKGAALNAVQIAELLVKNYL